jgi:hypothetical protein
VNPERTLPGLNPASDCGVTTRASVPSRLVTVCDSDSAWPAQPA